MNSQKQGEQWTMNPFSLSSGGIDSNGNTIVYEPRQFFAVLLELMKYFKDETPPIMSSRFCGQEIPQSDLMLQYIAHIQGDTDGKSGEKFIASILHATNITLMVHKHIYRIFIDINEQKTIHGIGETCINAVRRVIKSIKPPLLVGE